MKFFGLCAMNVVYFLKCCQGEDIVKSGKEELRKATLSERDSAMEELTKERSVDKPLSLLEIHQQNLRKKKMVMCLINSFNEYINQLVLTDFLL